MQAPPLPTSTWRFDVLDVNSCKLKYPGRNVSIYLAAFMHPLDTGVASKMEGRGSSCEISHLSKAASLSPSLPAAEVSIPVSPTHGSSPSLYFGHCPEALHLG